MMRPRYWPQAGVRLITGRRKNLTPNAWEDDDQRRRYRKTIETLNAQLEKIGLERLYARTNHGFDIKTQATLLALFFTNHFGDWQSRYSCQLRRR